VVASGQRRRLSINMAQRGSRSDSTVAALSCADAYSLMLVVFGKPV
jgi:hypothetical protein